MRSRDEVDPDTVEQIVRMGGCERALLLHPLSRSPTALPSPRSIRQSPTLSQFTICSPCIDEGLGDELCGDRVGSACVCVCVSELRPFSRSRSRDLGVGFGSVALLHRVQLHSVQRRDSREGKRERGERGESRKEWRG